MTPALLLLGALFAPTAASAADPAAVLALAELDIGVPHLELELPGESYRCWRLTLATDHGRRVQETLDALLRLRQRLRAALAAGGSSLAAPIAASLRDALDAAIKRGLVKEQRQRSLFGLRLLPHRILGILDSEDYALRRKGPDCN